MDASLALTGLLMGLAGGPHCLAMCGPVCAGLGTGDAHRSALRPLSYDAKATSAAPARPSLMGRASLLFLLGRLLSYSLLGLVAAASMQAVGWLSVQSAALRPVWTFVHVGAAVVGGFLLWQARQPPWLEAAGRWLGLRARRLGASGTRWAPLGLGSALALLPCGLLYSALLVAALSPGPGQGALVMASFALGGSLSLWLGPSLWRRLGRQSGQHWGMRLAGAVLLVSSLWALWLALAHDRAPWCLPPG